MIIIKLSSALPIVFGLYVIFTKKGGHLLLKFKSILIKKANFEIHNEIESENQSIDHDHDRDRDRDHCVIQCDILYEPDVSNQIRADIIFIHGLNGSLTKTWRQGLWNVHHSVVREQKMPLVATNSTTFKHYSLQDLLKRKMCNCSRNETSCEHCTNYTQCWPKDWLPQDCPNCRVIAISYTTDPYLWRPFWIKAEKRSSMYERGFKMIEKLEAIQVGHNPIIWVAHSKGGLFVKQMLVHASKYEQYEQFITNTKGILFYSVPHFGSKLADLLVPLCRKSIELLEVRKNCPEVVELHQRFLNVLEGYDSPLKVYSFVETTLTFMSIWYVRIVGLDSADPGLGELFGIPLDHRNICKPINRNCILYKQLISLINSIKAS